VPSPTPYGLPFLKIGVHNPTPKLQSLLSQERLKVRTANLADTFTWSIWTQADEKFGRKGSVGVSRDGPNFLSTPYYLKNGQSYELQIWKVYSQGPCEQKPFKIWENRERGRIQGRPKFFKYPLLSQEWVKLRTSNLAGIFTGSIQTKALQNVGENGAWAWPGTVQFFWVPPIISGTGKAANFKFCTRILSIDRNKSPLQISAQVAGCVVRTLETFQGAHILGASRGRLCDSSAVLCWDDTLNQSASWQKRGGWKDQMARVWGAHWK